jgi:hypothetical protein
VDRVERDRRAGGTAQVVLQRGGADDLEAQRALLGDAVQRAAIRPGDRLGRGEDLLQQPVDVALGRERRADRVQLLEAMAEVFSRLGSGEEPQSLGRLDAGTARGRPGAGVT